MKSILYPSFICLIFIFISCENRPKEKTQSLTEPPLKNSEFSYKTYQHSDSDLIISRSSYYDQLYGFWLGQCIANWTGLVTEMDKIGNIGDIKTGEFYTRDDWGKPDQPSIWG
ncbi:MAG: hypothetical protein ACR2MV_07130, partial [Lutimonas sp.]